LTAPSRGVEHFGRGETALKKGTEFLKTRQQKSSIKGTELSKTRPPNSQKTSSKGTVLLKPF